MKANKQRSATCEKAAVQVGLLLITNRDVHYIK